MLAKVYPLMEVREGAWKAPAVNANVANELSKGSGHARNKKTKKASNQRARKPWAVSFGGSDSDGSDEEGEGAGEDAGAAQTQAG
eukprot:317423-Prymnesium_polylepis.1